MLLFLVFFPLVMAPLGYLLGRRSKRGRDVFVILCAFAELVAACLSFFLQSAAVGLPSVCAYGLCLESDGFRRIYAVIIAFMWAMTLLFSPEYNAHHHNRNRYYFFQLLTLGATMGVFYAADLFTAFVFFEIMSFTSFTWVIQEETPGALRAANTYLAVAVLGGLVALMGIFLLQHSFGTTSLSALYAHAGERRGLYYAAGGCILFGFGAKAGMFPLHIWLPKAHPVAPAPASALLSGVLTKSGVWGILAISCNLFRYDPAWGTVILLLGCVTMLLGAVLALLSVDLKRTLACSSMSQIGFILVGVGMMGLLGSENALASRGTLLHMVNHSLFKLVLFLCAGVVYMNLHQLDLNEIRGFGRRKPLLHAAFLLGALGIGGVPLLNGYISKTLLHESIVEGAAHYGVWLKLVEWVFLCSGGLTVAYMTKLYVVLFLEKHPRRQAEYDAKARYMNQWSSAALSVSALLLPLLGVSADFSMNRIADTGTDFFRCGPMEHAVRYLSWENLKGALISISIGAAVYLFVVRRLLRKNGNYVNRLPKRLDLEELLYRPLLLRWLPGFFGVLATLFAENRVLRLLRRAPDLFGAIAAVFAENRLLRSVCRVSRLIGALTVLFAENRVLQQLSRAALRTVAAASRGVARSTDGLLAMLGRTVYRPSQKQPDSDLSE